MRHKQDSCFIFGTRAWRGLTPLSGHRAARGTHQFASGRWSSLEAYPQVAAINELKANLMANDTRFKPAQSGNPHSTFKAGNKYRWQPGQSGNPAGIARSRLRFEECFYASLIEQGAAQEAASLLWESARKHEPWAVQALLQRLAPETKQIRLTHGVEDEPTVDYTRLSDEELEHLERILERAKIPAGTSENGEG